MLIEFVVRVSQRLKVLAHTRLPDDIKRGAGAPFRNFDSTRSMHSGICGGFLGILARSILRFGCRHGGVGRFL